MTSDDIRLPDFLIADLYKSSLVEIEDRREKEKTKPTIVSPAMVLEAPVQETNLALKFLGQNQKNIIVVLNTSEAAYINDDDLQFLTSILKACNFNLGDIAIINTDIQQVTFGMLKDTLMARYVLLFGVEPSHIKLPFVIPAFQVQQYAGCTLIAAPKLQELNAPTSDGKLLKSRLWVSLKRCFDL